jgi:hypothetical protein
MDRVHIKPDVCTEIFNPVKRLYSPLANDELYITMQVGVVVSYTFRIPAWLQPIMTEIFRAGLVSLHTNTGIAPSSRF